MSDLNTNATVTLTVNGRQAAQMLDNLKVKATQLETAIDKARQSGDKASLKRLQRELNQTNAKIRQIQSATATAEDVLRRLDRATPKQLNQTLTVLRRQLNGIERGSEAWNVQVAKIKAVKGELERVNAELREGESRWSRLNRTLNDWQMTIMGAVAAVTGLVMAGRSAVKAYADMDAEMANVRKFTGMTEEQVKRLNEEFKRIDTRTAREDLNRLAEEAGKLGKTTQEDVLGFVRAADQINVALDELGDGATLTLSKLTNIFGDEERLGTEKALLAVGSVINELSQNCTASAPYLANFAQRMAGVGAQAHMTIPEIMGLAAVLDAQGQKVEMSSTAVSKVIMDMFKQQDQIIKATGLNAKKFKETVTKDTNEGLLMLLEQLHSLGNIDVLAPVFKEMGENGARAAQVISALAGNLEMIRWEQGEAAKAFEAATSVTKEFNVQNNTVQAGLEKARKRIAELSVELGEKLMPVMRHVMSSTSMILRILSVMVDFISRNRVAIISATAAVVAYNVALNVNAIRFKVQYAWLVLTEKATVAYNAAQKGLQAVTVAMQYAVAKLTGNYARQQLLLLDLRKNAAALTNVYALMAAAVAAAAAALVVYLRENDTAAKVKKMMNGLHEEAVKKIGDEKVKIDLLVGAAQNERLSLEERKKAVDKLNAIIPEYNARLDETSGRYTANKQALDKYLESLVRMYELEGARDKLAELGREKMEAHQQVASAQKQVQNVANAPGTWYMTSFGMVGNTAVDVQGAAERRLREARKAEEVVDAKIKALTDVYGADLQQAEVNAPISSNEPTEPEPVVLPPADDDKKKTKSEDRFKEEKEWREREQAMIRISYAKGEADYEEYQKRLEEIEVEYNRKRLERGDLTQQERVTAEAVYYEALAEQAKGGMNRTKEAEERSLEERRMALQQRYIDGEMDTKSYQGAMEMLELEHARTLVSIYKEGTKERLEAEKVYQNRLLADAEKRRKEYEAKEKEHQQRMQKLKDEYFGLSLMERTQGLSEDLAALRLVYQDELQLAGDNAREKLRIEEAYQKARAALVRKYGMGEVTGMQAATKAVVEWMESEGGEAVLESFDAVVSGMGAVFSGLSDIVQSELEIQTAALTKRYEAEVSFAEGNTYKVKKLEREKEEEIARLKNEANKKMFAMQVIQAIAQTAQNALAAYGSAAQVPLVGYILAPIAAAMAVAAGGVQIAAIKKQQQASEAQGYAEGGFTRDGDKYEVAGVVHAGEWVASQRLVRSPVARPMIEALDYAQRTNTIGSLRSEDVSRAITAPSVLAEQARGGQLEAAMVANAAALASYSSAIEKLNRRLKEPFVTVNTVEGDRGMKKAQEEYDKLMRNKDSRTRA